MKIRVADEKLESRDDQAAFLTVRDWRKLEGRDFRATGAMAGFDVAKLSSNGARLRDVASVHLGLVLASNDLLSDTRTAGSPDPILFGRDLQRYVVPTPTRWFSFESDEIVGGTKNPSVYQTGPRLVFQAIRNLKLRRRLVGTVVDSGIFTIGTVHNVICRSAAVDYRALLGVLNSALMNLYYSLAYPEHRIKGAYLENLPLPALLGLARNSPLVDHVNSLLDLNLRGERATTAHDRELVQRQIAATDAEIDRLVYELYELTPEEIAIVEKATERK